MTTTLQHDIQAKDRERSDLDRRLSAFLDTGKMIEVLSPATPVRDIVSYNHMESDRGQRHQ